MSAKKTALIILDGWGLGDVKEADAIQNANTPFVDQLLGAYPNSTLVTYGEDVGLPAGQMGNSEVGHLNIGAGRIVYQELARINKSIREKEINQNAALIEAIQYAKKSDQQVHLIGLLSDGGVHSHINHLKAFCDILDDSGLEKVFIHAFMDGRDTDPKGGVDYLEDLLGHINDKSIELASIVGRYFAMDRDKRWERIKLAYDLLVKGEGELTTDPIPVITKRYSEGETDEFIKPIVLANQQGMPKATIQEGDVVICFNFRTDRPRQITAALTQQAFPDYEMKPLNLHYVAMTRYDNSFQNLHVLFEKATLENGLGEVLSKAHKSQVRIAETEKYPHVTYFFSGGIEEEFEGEKRIMIPSPKVATYDLKPEMSAIEITEAILEEIDNNQPDFICLNYANADMVGHTGDFSAAINAVECVDNCLKRLVEKLLTHDYASIIIADHGNSDFMINQDGSPNTAHTKNLVPCIYVSSMNQGVKLSDGKLADVAPTLLNLMELTIPDEMDGNILISEN